MTAMRTIWLIARRDFRERLASRAFQISTVIIILLVVGLIVAPSFFSSESPEWIVGSTTNSDISLAEAIEAAAPNPQTSVTIVAVDDAAVETSLRHGDVDIVVTADAIIAGPAPSSAMVATVSAAVGALRFSVAATAAGLDPSEVATLLAAADVSVVELDPIEGDDENVAAAFIASVLLFVAIVTYGQWILVGVVEEKANRVVEVVLGTVRSHRLLAGKVAGIGALGVVQLTLVGIAAALASRLSGTLELPSGLGSVAGIVLLWFILGYAFYATAYAAAGSLVSRVEEAQNAAFPLTMVLMLGYFTAVFSIEGDNAVLRVASLLPPFAPVTMPVRMAAGSAAAWEIFVSLSLMVIAIYLLIRIAGRIYTGGLLRARGRTKISEAWKSA